MRTRFSITAAVAIIGGLALALATAGPSVASAHEQRDIAGKYHLVVGFINEPAIAEQPNGIDLTITDLATKQPVEGVEKTLKAQLIYGGSTQDVTLRTRFGMPGKYTADLIPTKSGTYKFHFTGQINGDNVDETFVSGPGRFNDVQSQDSLHFPVKEASTLDLSSQAAGARSAADSAKSSANTAIAVGIAGAVAGALGLIAGGVAIRRTRRTGDTARATTTVRPAS